jgi:hypothetical protein
MPTQEIAKKKLEGLAPVKISRPALPIHAPPSRRAAYAQLINTSALPELAAAGGHYYELHGKPIFTPADALRRPDNEALRWHNEHAYRG